MGLLASIRKFGELHARMKSGGLAAGELAEYDALRTEAMRVLLAAQRAEPGQSGRRTLRVARALRVNVGLSQGAFEATTVDISAGGFAVVLPDAPLVGENAQVTLHVPGQEPVESYAQVVHSMQAGTAHRVALEFKGLHVADTERLELFVLESALEHFS